jgi:hypothetical protein
VQGKLCICFSEKFLQLTNNYVFQAVIDKMVSFGHEAVAIEDVTVSRCFFDSIHAPKDMLTPQFVE